MEGPELLSRELHIILHHQRQLLDPERLLDERSRSEDEEEENCLGSNGRQAHIRSKGDETRCIGITLFQDALNGKISGATRSVTA